MTKNCRWHAPPICEKLLQSNIEGLGRRHEPAQLAHLSDRLKPVSDAEEEWLIMYTYRLPCHTVMNNFCITRDNE